METVSNSSNYNQSIYIIGPREMIGSSTESAVFIRILFVLLLRVGLILIQIGTIPTHNVYRILFQNVVDMGVCLLSYGVVGFTLNFGSESLEGVVGHGTWIDSDMKYISLHQAGYGFASVLVGTGIVTTALCTRLHILAIAIISFFYSAILYPIVSHWLWVDHGWMQSNQAIVKDYAGGLAVHSTASTFAAAGGVLLGRRLLRFSEISEISVIGVETSKNTVTGYMLLIIGLIVFSLPTPEEEFRLKYNNFDGVLFTNSILALSAAGLVTIFLDIAINCRRTVTYWSLLKYFQAAVAGVVALSCGVDVFSAIESFVIGLIAGALFFFTASLINHTVIEDNCNIIAINLACSFLASISSQLTYKDLTKAQNRNIVWQLTCHFIILGASFVSAILILLLLCVTKRLRSKSETINHKRAKAACKNKRIPSFIKLFNFSKGAKYIEPGRFKSATDIQSNMSVLVGKNIKHRLSQNRISSKESIVPQISSSNTDVFKQRSKRFINLQENSTKWRKGRL